MRGSLLLFSSFGLLAGATAVLVLFGVGCGSAAADAAGDTSWLAAGDPCAAHAAGCACEGTLTERCGTVTAMAGDYVFCSEGNRQCVDGHWSDCVGDRVVTKSLAPGLRPLGLGADAGICTNACDPYCQQYRDTPQGLAVDGGLQVTDAGLTLTGGQSSFTAANCTGVTVTPVSSTVTVSNVSPLTFSGSGSVALTAALTPAGCYTGSFPVVWSADDTSMGTFSTTTSTTSYTIVSPHSGPVQITAFANGVYSAPVTVNVVVTAVDPSDEPPPGQRNKFLLTPSVAEPNQIVYPYPGTHFPLGLLPPVLQWTTSGGSETTKITLRYPVGTGTTFKWEGWLHPENNTPGHPEGAQNRFNIPKAVWDAFTESARGQDAEIVLQRTNGANLKYPRNVVFHVLDGTLKGTIYYNSYNSPIAKGSSPATSGLRGGVLAFRPGTDTVPKLAVRVGTSTTCIDCHTVSSDGKTLIAQEENTPGGADYRRAFKWNPSAGAFPITTTLQSYAETASGDGRKFVWGAQYPDGSFGLSNVGDNVASNSYANVAPWTSPFMGSAFYPTTSSTPAAMTVTSWPSDVQAVQPAFSHDGRALAFNHWAGSAVGGVAARSGRALTVVDFACGQATGSVACTAAKSISNARRVYDDTTNTKLVGWPSFVPDRSGVVYQVTQRLPNPSGLTFNGTKMSDLSTVFGAQAEIWMSPAAGPSTSARRLDQLNGWKPTMSGATATTNGTTTLVAAGANFTGWNVQPGAWLRIGSGTAAGSYHVRSVTNATTLVLSGVAIAGSGSFVVEVPQTTAGATLVSYLPYTTNHTTGTNVTYKNAILAPYCSSYTTTAFNEEMLNYQPTMNPTASGGASWVVFTSRRRYGNVATGNPWEPEATTCGDPLPTAPAKQLWMAAIDEVWTAGRDPSHPPLYLQGQELPAGNSRGFWSQSACVPPGTDAGSVCTSNDDCCEGSSCAVDSAGPPVIRHCRASSTPSCNATGGACTTASDCCITGSVCGGSPATCSLPTAMAAATMTRDYASDCILGEKVAWRLFRWNARESAPTTNASIVFSVQTRAKTTDAWSPATPLTVATANSTNWNPLPAAANVADVDTVLKANGLESKTYLRVTMRLNPSSSGASAPILQNWDQQYACPPVE